MKKILHPQTHNLIQIALVFALWTLIIFASASIARADAAPPPDPTVGGVGPYQPQKTNVQMMSETVFIEVPPSPSNLQEPKQIKVNTSFTMRNQGEDEEKMQVIFPLTRLNTGGSEEALYQIDPSSFVAKVHGQTLPFTTITTPPESTISDATHGFSSNVQWAAFEIAFPVQQDVILQVDYEMLNPYGAYGEGFTGIAYILETGAGWYGNILAADITLRLPYAVTEEAISQANSGYVISGNELQWKLKNIEPTRQDNLEIRVIHADLWKGILDLRSRINQNPDDVDAWAGLGDRYRGLGIHMREGYIIGINEHFTELAIAARQEVIRLRPKSGDDHYKLAEILWLSNPSIKNKLRMGGESTAPEPSLDDPAIQQILHEQQLALSLGAKDALPYLSKIFPQLLITADAITTVTAISPIITLTPVATHTMLPAIQSTFTPAALVTSTSSPIKPSSPANDSILIIVVIVLIIISISLVYQWRSKLRT